MKQFSVTQLNKFIKNVFEDEYILNNIAVSGEVLECNIVRGNSFFNMGDSESSISCVMFGKVSTLTRGCQIVAIGTVKFYAKTGSVNFVVHTVNNVNSDGQKYQAYLKLKHQLQSLGLFENRLPLPKIINKIALITSKEGAVIHDFIGVVRKVNKAIDIVVVSVKVQGESSQMDILQAFDIVQNLKVLPDCIVLARGGGSSVDLDVFNSEFVVKKVAYCRIPVVSAIGHESDYTLCDLVSSVRAGTPSIAAQMIVKDLNLVHSSILDTLKDLQDSLYSILLKRYNTLSYYLQSIINFSSFKLASVHRAVQRQVQNLSTHLEENFVQKQNILGQLTVFLEQLNPVKLLSKGYAKLQREEYSVTSVLDLHLDDVIKVFLSDGQFNAKIVEIVASEKECEINMETYET
ncbi:MAG: exodeoxyribonuclease VII large subunit [Clostridiales bacterium]|jgi:exodeoxyribonuclease VII large subunit|nr:exodeoxyribonuclease VII large subunit [Clostridiales bacterium]